MKSTENQAVTLNQKQINAIVKQVVKQFSELKGAKFIGIREYRAKTSNELANHVLNANFNYGNAVEKDLTSLMALNVIDIDTISDNTGIPSTIILDAVNALITSFEKNQNKETQSNQSKAQNELYLPITSSIKLNLTTGLLHIYALAVSKQIIEKGEYKTVTAAN